MIKAYKDILGYKPIKGDKLYSHVILTISEYDEIRKNNRLLNERIASDNNDFVTFETKISYLESELKACKGELAHVKKENETLTELANELVREKADVESLNTNLLRICRERSNATRQLRPKKAHSGYVAKKSEQAVKVWYEAKKRTEQPVWRTIIETPYQVELTEKQARDLITDDIENKDIMMFKGTFFTDFRMYKDMQTRLWCIILETRNEFEGIV